MSAVRLAGIVLVLPLTGACAAATSTPVPPGAGLRGRGAAVPSTVPDGGHTMPGMLSPVQFDVLERREGAGFDRLWKSGLAAHLGSGVRMAETVRAGGQHPPTAAFVETLINEQTDLIGELGGPA
ncbi:MAG: DUF305 domain-containing protein [Thermoactinospora sp.]|nr:DUF305 domain-containing protein [Thermoactinospora sp.]